VQARGGSRRPAIHPAKDCFIGFGVGQGGLNVGRQGHVAQVGQEWVNGPLKFDETAGVAEVCFVGEGGGGSGNW
jgi:hypothetical protein